MTQNFEIAPTPRAYAEQVLSQSKEVLKDAVAIAFPDNLDADPIQAFPKPSELRAESSNIPELTEDRQAMLLTKAEELGFGKAEDVGLSEQGLIGATVIIEGGQPHKMLAEALMVIDDTEAHPKTIFISASPHRFLTNEAEIGSAQRLFGRVGRSEYDVAADVARALPGFNAYPLPNVLAAAYDIDANNSVSQEHTGQFQTVGEVRGVPIVLMQINRRDLDDGKYDRQPNTAAVISIVDAITRANGDEDSPLVHVTSGTYRPSRALGVALAGLSVNRLVGLATYGNDRLNSVRGNNAPVPINQLPGELHEMALQSEKLEAVLNA